MDQILIIFVALAVAGVAWGASLLVVRVRATDKRKLQQRLGVDVHSEQALHNSPRMLLQTSSTGLPEFLNKLPAAQSMQRWLGQAIPDARLSKFLMVEVGFSTIAAVLVWLVSANELMGFFAGVAAGLIPFLVVKSRRSSRRKQFSMQLPEALDFLSRVMRSGQTFSTGLQMISEELPEPLAGEFRRCYDQHSLGQSLEDGLRDMAARLNSADFAFFATAVIIQRQTGGDLAGVLHNISDMIRKRVRLAQSVKAKTAEGRFTGYVMVCFPAIMFAITYFIDPVRGDVMLKTSAGHMLIGIAVGLEIFGLFLIRQITTVKV